MEINENDCSNVMTTMLNSENVDTKYSMNIQKLSNTDVSIQIEHEVNLRENQENQMLKKYHHFSDRHIF